MKIVKSDRLLARFSHTLILSFGLLSLLAGVSQNLFPPKITRNLFSNFAWIVAPEKLNKSS